MKKGSCRTPLCVNVSIAHVSTSRSKKRLPCFCTIVSTSAGDFPFPNANCSSLQSLAYLLCSWLSGVIKTIKSLLHSLSFAKRVTSLRAHLRFIAPDFFLSFGERRKYGSGGELLATRNPCDLTYLRLEPQTSYSNDERVTAWVNAV